MADDNVTINERDLYNYYKHIYDLYESAELEFNECVESVNKYVKDFNDPTMDLTYRDKVFGGVSNSKKRALRANIIVRLLNSIEFYSKFLLCAENIVSNRDVKSSKSIEAYMSSFGHNSKITFIELLEKLSEEDLKKMEVYIKSVANRTNKYTPFNLIEELNSLFKDDEINSTIATKGRYNIPNMEKFNKGSFVLCMGYVTYLRNIGKETFVAMEDMLVKYEQKAGLYQSQHVSQNVKGGDAQ